MAKKKYKSYLIVDGYNIINDWEELYKTDGINILNKIKKEVREEIYLKIKEMYKNAKEKLL